MERSFSTKTAFSISTTGRLSVYRHESDNHTGETQDKSPRQSISTHVIFPQRMSISVHRNNKHAITALTIPFHKHRPSQHTGSFMLARWSTQYQKASASTDSRQSSSTKTRHANANVQNHPQGAPFRTYRTWQQSAGTSLFHKST